MPARFRIRDLLAGRTLVESCRGRDLIAYHQEHYRPGYCEWLWQYQDERFGWREVPPQVRKTWRMRHAHAL